jgi:hypothetical protein
VSGRRSWLSAVTAPHQLRKSSAAIPSFAWLIVINFASCGVGGIASGFSRGAHDYLLHLVFAIYCISILLSRVSLTALSRYDAEGSPSEDHG